MFSDLGLSFLPRASTSDQTVFFVKVLMSVVFSACEHKVT